MKKIVFIIIAGFLLSGCNRLDEHQPFTSSTSVLMPGDSVSQSIEVSRNNLNTVSICLRNPSHTVIPLTFTLSQNNQVIRTLDFSSANIDKDDCTKLKFVPVDNSAGQTYLAKVESTKVASELIPPPTILVEKNDSNLHYKTFYYQSTHEVVKESFVQFWRRLFLDPWFILVWVGLIVVTVVKIARSKSEF